MTNQVFFASAHTLTMTDITGVADCGINPGKARHVEREPVYGHNTADEDLYLEDATGGFAHMAAALPRSTDAKASEALAFASKYQDLIV